MATLRAPRCGSMESASSWTCWAACCKKTKTELLNQGETMPKLVARCIAISLDGFSAAKGQALDAPFGKDGLRLMQWARATQYFARMVGPESGAEGLDNDFLVHAHDNL